RALQDSASCRTPRTVRLGRSRLGTCWKAVWQTRRSARPFPSRSRTAGRRRRCGCRSARSSIRARAPVYGWSKGKRLGSLGVTCKSPASAAKRLRSSAISRRAIASWRSVRICCTKASTCAWLKARPRKTWRRREGTANERLQSLRPRRTRALGHFVPAHGDLHRRRRGLSDVGPGRRPILHDKADDSRNEMAGGEGEGEGKKSGREVRQKRERATHETERSVQRAA